MKRFLLVALILCAIPAFAQSPPGGYGPVIGGSSASSGVSVSLPSTSTLSVWHRVLATDSITALTDSSGAGHTSNGTTGTAPTIISGTGGISCGGAGAVILNSALNSTIKTWAIVMQFDSDATFNGSNRFRMMIGGGASTNSAYLLLENQSGLMPQLNGGHLLQSWNSGVGETRESEALLNGTFTLVWSMDTSDRFYVNGTETQYPNSSASSSSVGINNNPWQVCGNAVFDGQGASSWFNGKIYEIAGWTSVLTPAQAYQAHNALMQDMASRGVPLATGTANTGPLLMWNGDSLFEGNGLLAPPSSYMFQLSGVTISNVGIVGDQISTTFPAGPLISDTMCRKPSSSNTIWNWEGTNDLLAGATPAVTENNLASYFRARSASFCNWQMGVLTMITRGNVSDATRNSYNALIRAHYQRYAPGNAQLIDIAGDPFLGVNGGSSNTRYFNVDTVHESDHSARNILAIDFTLAYLYQTGCQDWSCATTLTSGAAAATSITGSTESGNTATITSTLNPGAGVCVVITGVSTAGYNSDANECWNPLTSSSTNITYYNPTASLATVGTSGTISSPLQQGKKYVILGGSSISQNYTLDSCVPYIGNTVYAMVTDTNAWTITPFGSQTINGAATLTTPVGSATNSPVVALKSVLVSAAAAGCNWESSNQ